MKKFIYLWISLCSIFFYLGCHNNGGNNPGENLVCKGYDLPDAENIDIFPSSHPLNTDISALAKDSRSDAIISFIAEGNPGLKADFGSGLWDSAPIGIPYIVVCKDQAKISITFRGNAYDDDFGDESDPGPYPIPITAPVEGNGQGDSHVIAVDVDNMKLYELYNASVSGNGWGASGGAVFDLSTTTYRPLGWTSADAAGLPIFPCLVRYDEVVSGKIDHAIRFTLPKAKVMRGYILPASHVVNGGNLNPDVPTPFGMRLRLKANVDISSYSNTNQIILTAMKKYGIILADIGSSFYISGAPDERWNNDDLQLLRNIKATNFEVVAMGTISVK
jgi:hypothetical protein